MHADFAYIRWLGDRKGIEEKTKTWDKTIIDRSAELREWVDVCRKISGRGVPIFAFANNHYAGNGPATVRLFQELWKEHPEAKTRAKRPETLSLF
jgi:uncharacterized protein YecE (DUF72 family)